MEHVEIGKSYICKPIGLTNEVVGTVEHAYTNTVVITVEDCHRADRAKVIEYQHRMLVRYEDVQQQIGIALVG
ncbi:hypothetical protein [Enterococcus diestrammenae]|uniref:hypothetical protein n=1 Tax=Enterococcus diestrammenae TaxID=1155073 RepID=UPI0022E68759|nr:hypothetical protein [Enterococcus diestrammenae]